MTETPPKNGWSGAKYVSAPLMPIRATTILLQTGHPMAEAERRLPPIVRVWHVTRGLGPGFGTYVATMAPASTLETIQKG
jgi:hypothetical protein